MATWRPRATTPALHPWIGCASLRQAIWRKRPSSHALEDTIAFDEPMVESARDMKRDDHADQNSAD
jgi:hypothetical protein